MKYSVGDVIDCDVEILENGKKKICTPETSDEAKIELMSFEIVYVDEIMKTYKIIIDDNMSGWIIGKFAVKYEEVDEKFLGKKFYDLPESWVID